MTTWTRGGSLTLAASPSLLFSNLSSMKEMICFVRLSEVIVVDTTTEHSNRISLPKLQIYQAAMINVGNSICVAVASNQGLQVWSTAGDGSTMLFFYALSEILPSSCDPEDHFMRGITCNSTHLAVGSSLGIALVFSTVNDINNQCIPSFSMSKPESNVDPQSHNIVFLEKINCKDVGPNDTRLRDLSNPRPLPPSNPAITVMASSSRIFAGGNEDGEIFAFTSNGLSSGTFLDPVVKFPTDVAGAPVTAMSIAHLDPTSDATNAIDVIYAGFADGHIRIYRTKDNEPEMSIEIAAHVRTVTGLCVCASLGCFITCSEDQFMQVWRMPDFLHGKYFPSNGGGEGKHNDDHRVEEVGGEKSVLLSCEKVDNRLCTGIARLPHRKIAIASYDDDCLVVFQGQSSKGSRISPIPP